LANRRPSGYDALANGLVWQNRIAEEWKAEGHQVTLGWGHDQPDIVLSFPYGLPPVLVSVKTFNLVPSNMRYGEDGRHSYASARTIRRKDVIAEIAYALSNPTYAVILTVVNQRNGVAEHVELDPTTFRQYTTSQRLNDDSAEKEYAIWDLRSPVILEVNEALGWKKIINPHFDSEGQQIG
jgi:hypothetical protein